LVASALKVGADFCWAVIATWGSRRGIDICTMAMIMARSLTAGAFRHGDHIGTAPDGQQQLAMWRAEP
jgi:hypothetical protein